MQGMVRDALLAFGDGSLHGVKARGELSKFVVCLHFHHIFIVTGYHSPGCAGQYSERLRNRRGEPGARHGDERDQRCTERDESGAGFNIGLHRLFH